jgi:hypothetical protein
MFMKERRRKTSKNQKGTKMFKYEEEINARLANFDYAKEWYNWVESIGLTEQQAQTWFGGHFGGGMNGLSPNAKLALKKYYRFTKDGLVKIGGGFRGVQREEKFDLPTMEMPCAKCNYQGSALYFLGMMCTNPEGKEYYLVKIGASKETARRVRDYAVTNPMIFHDNIILPCDEDELKEKEYNCHKYLASMAYAIAQNSYEWFYVTKENYFLLCKMFKDTTFFQMVADGEVE